MKKSLLLALALIAAFSPSAVVAQTAQPAAEKPKETCPCSNPSFVPKTEKAKAVLEYWEARGKTRVAGVIGTFALLGALLSQRPTQTLNEAGNALGQAQYDMEQARGKAQKLGGLKVEGAGEDARVTVTLEKGVDYTLGGK
jgi:hypothetical protein